MPLDGPSEETLEREGLLPWRRGSGCLLGLAGPAGCGKTKAARTLEWRGWERESFAAPLRSLAEQLYPDWATDALIWTHPYKDEISTRYGLSPRHALRTLGEGLRAIDPEIWLMAMSRRLRQRAANGQWWVVIDDVRREEEAALIRDLGGQMVHVLHPTVTWRRDHPTEMGIRCADRDVMILNDGDLESWVGTWQSLGDQLRSGARLGGGFIGRCAL